MKMREIKFRAWSPNSKRMYLPYPNSDLLIRISGEVQLQIDVPENTGLDDLVEPGVILMQYTGLKDSRGVDIYEGDILSADGQTWDVRWISENDNWDFTGFQMEQTYSQNWHRSEIIGNIYENPELL